MKKMVPDKTIQVRILRNFPGRGKRVRFSDLENQLIEWIRQRNAKGLTVSNKYLMARAIVIKKKILEITQNNINDCSEENNAGLQKMMRELELFLAPPGWASNFRKRFNLVFRSQT